MAEDLPLTVNPDDPALWGAEATSYDWLQFFLASGNQTGLGMLKQLAVRLGSSALLGPRRVPSRIHPSDSEQVVGEVASL